MIGRLDCLVAIKGAAQRQFHVRLSTAQPDITDQQVVQRDNFPGPGDGQAVRPAGGGRLEATLIAPTVSGTTNGLTQIVFSSLQNGNVQLGPGSGNAGVTIPLGGAQTVTFIVTRQTAGQATHVAFTVRDSCGDWPSFVGGGAGAF